MYLLPRNLNLDTTQHKHLLKNCEPRETHDGSKIDAVDQTSDLPEFILHHILSFLPKKRQLRFVFCPRNGIVYGLQFVSNFGF